MTTPILVHEGRLGENRSSKPPYTITVIDHQVVLKGNVDAKFVLVEYVDMAFGSNAVLFRPAYGSRDVVCR